jgi:hypothetical protein
MPTPSEITALAASLRSVLGADGTALATLGLGLTEAEIQRIAGVNESTARDLADAIRRGGRRTAGCTAT